MTSDIERMVRDRLHAEMERLVPERISPDTEFKAFDPQPETDDLRLPRRGRRWRLPLLTAAAVIVIALTAIPLFRGDTSTIGSHPTSTDASAGQGYDPVGPAMPTLGRERAVELLAAWDRAAPGQPPPTHFDNSQISGTAAGQGIESVHVHGAVVTVEFTGGTIPKNQDCGYGYTASALASGRAVAIFIDADPGTWPDGPDVNCAYVGKSMTATLTLASPLGDRPILDVTTGSVVAPTP